PTTCDTADSMLARARMACCDAKHSRARIPPASGRESAVRGLVCERVGSGSRTWRDGMAGRLQDKVGLVVGAGSVGPGWGNGKAAAVLFAREGAKVLCADVNEGAARETAGLIAAEGGTAQAIRADVTSHDDVRRMVKA